MVRSLLILRISMSLGEQMKSYLLWLAGCIGGVAVVCGLVVTITLEESSKYTKLETHTYRGHQWIVATKGDKIDLKHDIDCRKCKHQRKIDSLLWVSRHGGY